MIRIRLIIGLLLVGVHINSQAQSRFDIVSFPQKHPRIWVNDQKINWLKEKFTGQQVSEVVKATGTSVTGLSLAYLITGNEEIGQQAIDQILGPRNDKGSRFYDLDTKEGRSKARSIQAPLADMAICYDYCHPLLNQAEKDSLQQRMVVDMRKRINFARAWRSFHNAMYAQAWPLTAATIALYYEHDMATESWDFLKPELEDAMEAFELFPDGEWCEGFDYNRHSTYHMIRILLAIRAASGQDFLSSSIHIKNTGKYILYATKPNGLALPADDNDWPYIGDWEHVALLMLNEVFRDSYNQYYINHCPFERFQLDDHTRYAGVLWYDATIPETELSELPPSRYFRGKGLLIGKSSWDWDTDKGKSNATWYSFHCGDYWGDHAHNDINNLEIYHKGSLAVDAGRYDDDWGIEVDDDSTKIRQSQFFNYYRRTIAHNTILVKDPDEYISQNLINDGGQLNLLRPTGYLSYRNVPEDYGQGTFPSEEGLALYDYKDNIGKWETGDVIAYRSNTHFTYICGDGTAAYSAKKMQLFVRKVLFLQPDVFVVVDHVISKKPDFRKTWLLHSIEEPTLHKNTYTITHDKGQLYGMVISPGNHHLSKVGGKGKECIIDSIALPFGANAVYGATELHYGEEAGAWRIDLSPAVAQNDDVFVNVFQLGDSDKKLTIKARIDHLDDDQITLSLRNGKTVYNLLFSLNDGAFRIKAVTGKHTLFEEGVSHNSVQIDN